MKNFYAILTFLFLVSCSTSSDVVQHGFIQKRKYTKGFTHHKKDRSLFNKNSFSINKKTNEIANNHAQLKNLQSEVPSVTANKQKKTPEAAPLIASNNNDILINTDELLKENYYIKNDISELIKTKNKPFKKIRTIKEIIELTNDGDDEAKDNSKRNFILNLLVPGLGTMLNGKIGLGILQLLLFAAGIFGAYWIFWNTSIHTIYPILISIMAYGWSAYSGYTEMKPANNIGMKEIHALKESLDVKNEPIESTKVDSKSNLKAQQQELKKIRKAVSNDPKIKKAKRNYISNLFLQKTFEFAASYIAGLAWGAAAALLLVFALAAVYGGATITSTGILIFLGLVLIPLIPILLAWRYRKKVKNLKIIYENAEDNKVKEEFKKSN